MHLAIGIYKYFPFSGLALDMLRIANESVNRGHQVTIFTRSWQGDKPENITVVELKARGLSNHAKAMSFHRLFFDHIDNGTFDLTIGFNKIPSVDYYFCGDYCYRAHSINKNSFLYRLTPRYRSFCYFENEIFSSKSKTKILSLSEHEKGVFKQHYQTQDSRFIDLPPMLEKAKWVNNKCLPSRTDAREALGIEGDNNAVLFVGSGFERKGLDRIIKALAKLPLDLREKTFLYVIGQDKAKPYEALANTLGIVNQVIFLGGRKDVPSIMRAGDLLVHPARAELAGGVIIEGIVSGLPVLVTSVCGYSTHVSASKAGIVLGGEFSQGELDSKLTYMLSSSKKTEWHNNGIEYSKNDDLYAMSKCAVDAFESRL